MEGEGDIKMKREKGEWKRDKEKKRRNKSSLLILFFTI